MSACDLWISRTVLSPWLVFQLTVLDDLAGQISRRGVWALRNVTDSIGNGTVRVSIRHLIQTIIDKSAEFRTDIKVLQNDTGGFNLQSIKEEIDIIEFYRLVDQIS